VCLHPIRTCVILATGTEGGGPRSTAISRFVTRYDSFLSPSPAPARPRTTPEYLSVLPTGRYMVLDGVADRAVDIKSYRVGSGEERDRTGELTFYPRKAQHNFS
jgi:hypothetical protein